MANQTPAGATPGINEPAVTEWFIRHVEGAVAPLRFTLVAGGRSNLTYRVDAANGTSYVLRRPPLGHLLPSAHDMAREHRIISALGPTAVPVPRALGYCADESVSDRPFYVMSFVDGHIVRDIASADVLELAARDAASRSLIDVLADLHGVAIDAIGLGDLGKREFYVERQLRRWHGQFTQSKAREIPLIDELHDKLRTQVPLQQRVSLVHGDYRLDNTMVASDGHVMAVLDWELCAIGDPLADLGSLLVYWPEPGELSPPLGEAATMAPGFFSRAQVCERYAQRSELDLSDMSFYVAFGMWKLACILEGVYVRYKTGAMGGDGYDFMALEANVPVLAQRSAEALKGIR